MKPLTSKILKRAGACKEQVALFIELGGDEKTITAELCIEHADKFDWNWAANNLLKASASAEYERALAPALAKYERVTASAWAEYNRATASALAEYERVRASAFWAAHTSEANQCDHELSPETKAYTMRDKLREQMANGEEP